jgi:FkbM family methyltransferase
MYNLQRKIYQAIRSTGILGSMKLTRLLAKVTMPLPKNPIWIKTSFGFHVKVDPFLDKGVERNLFYFGTYEPGTINIMKSLLKPGDTFVDVGANIGLMTMRAAEIVGTNGKVYAFEPNPKTNEILRENVDRNNLKNVQIESYALGSEIKEAIIYDRWDANRGAASLIKPEIETTSTSILQTTFDDYFKDSERISVVKIDVEGFELEVLNGAKNALNKIEAPILIIECSSTRENTFGDSIKPLYDFISSLNGYKVFKLAQGKKAVSKLSAIDRFEDWPKHDNIFCMTEKHIKALDRQVFV